MAKNVPLVVNNWFTGETKVIGDADIEVDGTIRCIITDQKYLDGLVLPLIKNVGITITVGEEENYDSDRKQN